MSRLREILGKAVQGLLPSISPVPKPVGRDDEPIRLEFIADLPTSLDAVDHAGRLELLEMTRHRLARDGQPIGELGGRPAPALAKPIDERGPGRIGEGGENPIGCDGAQLAAPSR